MIDRLRRGARLLFQLEAQIIAETGFIELHQLGGKLRIHGRLSPAGEVQQVEGVDTQGARGALDEMFGIQEGVGPNNFLTVLIE
jgi:hypothetical protein